MPNKNMPSPKGGPAKCGQCKWYLYPIRGKTCIDSREVLIDTPACIEFQPKHQRPYETLESDRFVKDIEASIEVYTKEYLGKISKEIKEYHLFDHTKLDPRSYMAESEMLELANRFERCQAYTDRVVELKNDLREQKGKIVSLLKDTQGYLFSHYTDVMRSLKNDTERGMFQRSIMPQISTALDRLDSTLDKLDLIHANLKDTHFSMKETSEAARVIWNTKAQSMSAGKLSRL
jgi:5'(3')-deoxyribonucleotidase